MNADRDKSEQPCTDTRCDAQTHPADDAVRAPESPATPEPHTGPTETREDAREAHSDDERVRKYAKALNLRNYSPESDWSGWTPRIRNVMAVADAELAQRDEWYDDLLRRTKLLDAALSVERARVARVEALMAHLHTDLVYVGDLRAALDATEADRG